MNELLVGAGLPGDSIGVYEIPKINNLDDDEPDANLSIVENYQPQTQKFTETQTPIEVVDIREEQIVLKSYNEPQSYRQFAQLEECKKSDHLVVLEHCQQKRDRTLMQNLRRNKAVLSEMQKNDPCLKMSTQLDLISNDMDSSNISDCFDNKGLSKLQYLSNQLVLCNMAVHFMQKHKGSHEDDMRQYFAQRNEKVGVIDGQMKQLAKIFQQTADHSVSSNISHLDIQRGYVPSFKQITIQTYERYQAQFKAQMNELIELKTRLTDLSEYKKYLKKNKMYDREETPNDFSLKPKQEQFLQKIESKIQNLEHRLGKINKFKQDKMRTDLNEYNDWMKFLANIQNLRRQKYLWACLTIQKQWRRVQLRRQLQRCINLEKMLKCKKITRDHLN